LNADKLELLRAEKVGSWRNESSDSSNSVGENFGDGGNLSVLMKIEYLKLE
jgi:hypothetical protein